MPDTVLYDIDGPIATLTLNRPERMNTMNAALLEDALEAIERAADDERVRVLILTGNGRAFCAGGDLEAMAEGTVPGVDGGPAVGAAITQLRTYMRTSQLLHDMPKVTIAAINGPCAGAGLSFACAVDLRYSAASAIFAGGFLKAGQTGDYGISWTLPRLIGSARARELLLLGDRIDASTAERYGLVNQVFADEELTTRVRELAERIAAAPAAALVLLKQNLVDSEQGPLANALDREAVRLIGNMAGQG
jgi:2-(1,2-epoxy-1,2-dihydrophenyl)acetyl-CoA isomerase